MGHAKQKTAYENQPAWRRRSQNQQMKWVRARYYDPGLGRFISADPLFIEWPELCVERPLECNLYGYANNNPIKFVDDTGTKVTVKTRELNIPVVGGIGLHSYIEVDRGVPFKVVQISGTNDDDSGMLRVDFGYDNSVDTQKGYSKTDSFEVKPPEGMSQREWDDVSQA